MAEPNLHSAIKMIVAIRWGFFKRTYSLSRGFVVVFYSVKAILEIGR